MIQISGRDTQASWKDLPSTSLFPTPGLPLILIGTAGVLAVVLGLEASELVLLWVFRKLQAGRGGGGWHLPVLMLYLSWSALVGVFGFLLSFPALAGTGRRLSALIDRNAWYLWDAYRKPIQETLRRDEVPVAYAQVDDPRLSTPLLFERLYLGFLALGHVLALTGVLQWLQLDPLMAGKTWAGYGLTTAVTSSLAVGWCGTSQGFAIGIGALAIFTQIFLAVLDPALTGPALGLPLGTLSAITLGLVGIGVSRNVREARPESLLVVTNRGLRRAHLEDGQVHAWQKADAPLLLVATPTATGVRMQVGSQDGRDKLRPFRLSGDGAGANVRAELHTQGLKAELQGSDESSGIAGHLGAVPLLGWILILVMIMGTHLSLVPSQVARLQMNTLFLGYQQEWASGKPENFEAGVAKLLASAPDLGTAQLTHARLLVELRQREEARKELEGLIARRASWPECRLVKQAKEELEKL